MEFNEFSEILCLNLKKIGLSIKEPEEKQLYKYMNMLIEWNQKINLTAIKEPKDIIIKHFVDSLTIIPYIRESSKLIDIGTGAGFPGIPVAIYRKDLKITLLDSLNKRVNFLNEVISKLNIQNIKTIHGRAEDFGQNNEYREKYDIAVSRAVAPMNVLSEYLVPFVKVGGHSIYMKGPNYKDEMLDIESALNKLGAKLENIKSISIKDENMERNLIIIEKVSKTSIKYPRKAGMPNKIPLK